VHEPDPAGVRRQPLATAPQRLRVAVEADQRERGMRAEQRRRVPAETERGVHDDGRVVDQGRREQCEHAVGEHRHMAGLHLDPSRHPRAGHLLRRPP
jgi:hypothetical protein